jgi:FecR protein
MTPSKKRRFLALGALSAALLCAPVAFGQAKDEYGEAGEGPDIVQQTVARISDVQGKVSYARGDDPENWQVADVNVPMTLGDRVYSDRKSRVELQVHGGDLIWLGSRTDLAALNLTNDTKQFALKSGVGTFFVRQLDEDDTWEVDTPNAAVTFERSGDYRIDVDSGGNTRVSVRQGAATVAAGGGQIALNSGEAIAIEGIDSPRYDVLAVSAPDAWDRWVGGRSGRFRHSASAQFVSADVVGVGDLDEYGRWDEIPEYGRVWSPSRVEVGWVPYRQGHWVWQDPWGWTWISTEPWGWAPYHYGRWVSWSSRWFWVPVAPSIRVVAYAPALVAFVGGGPGYAPGVAIGGGGYVGWFPLAPRDPLYAWWLPRPVVNVNVTNVTYVNRTYVTVVNQNTFVSSGSVSRNIVTSRTIVREVEAAPVIRGAAPVIPTLASTRISVGTAARAARPPAAIVSRQVVARVAPPPAPPSFQQKQTVLRENRGAPVTQAEAIKITSREQAQPRAVASVRPVTAEPGKVTLAPSARSASSASSRPQTVAPVAPVRGRASATAERPVAAGPVTGNKSRQPAAASPQPVERERVEPARVDPSPRAEPPQPKPAREEPRQAAPERVRPTPAPAKEPPHREAAPPSRPQAEPTTKKPQSNERVRPTPRPADAPRPGQNREVSSQERAPAARVAAPPVAHTRPTPVEHAAPPPSTRQKESAEPAAKERERAAKPRPSPTPKKS